MPDANSLIALLEKLTPYGWAILCVVALLRGWVVTAAHYTEVCRERDKQTELAIQATKIAERLTEARCR